jgi:hypothetical protein
MLKVVRRQIRTIIVVGVSAALVVVGVAAAQNVGGGSKSGTQEGAMQGRKMHRPPGGPGGVPMKDLTYGEFHVQKEGKAVVIRVDRGKIKSVDSESITLVENDESEVTIALDSETKVLGKPGSESSVSDLKAGQQVVVSGPKGEAAKAIALPPKKGGQKGGRKGGMRQGVPGGQQGGPGGEGPEGGGRAR